MTSVTDSIINSVVLIAAIIVFSVIVVTVTIQFAFEDSHSEMQVFLEERSNAAIDSFFTSTVEGVSVRSLVGDAIIDLRTEIVVDDSTINLTQVAEDRLSLMFGQDNYYFELEPVIKGVSFMFVLDASPSLEEEINIIADNIALLQEEIQDEIRAEGLGDELVIINIFVLPGVSIQEGCGVFEEKGLPNTRCNVLTPTQLYGDLLDDGWELPSFGFNSFAEWDNINHFTSSTTFAESDWAAGSAYAARFFDNNVFLQQQASLNFIFPLGDELATSSKADECFTKLDSEAAEFMVCQLCDDGCAPGSSAHDRSLFAVEQAVEEITSRSTTNRVFPIFSVECNFAYTPGWNTISTNLADNSYVQSFVDDDPFMSDDFPEVSWCSQDACGGCEQLSDESFCFQNQCWEALQDHMGLLADSTGGSIIDAQEVNNIPDSIRGSFEQAVEEFDFSIGVRDETRDRFVHEKIVQLPNGFLTKVRLWVYQE